MNIENDSEGAAVKYPPPLVFLCFLLTAYGVHHIWPISVGIFTEFKYIGIAMLILGLCIIFLIKQSFKHAKTNIEPWKPTTTIITTGVYAYSRNPIYIGFCLVPTGLGIFLNSVWVFISFIPSVILVYQLAIKKEEVYLEKKFGEQYLLYKKKVRRWL